MCFLSKTFKDIHPSLPDHSVQSEICGLTLPQYQGVRLYDHLL